MRHHLPLIAATLVLALGLAGFYVATLSLSYSSSSVVLLSPAPGNPLTAAAASGSGVQLTVAMETEEQLVPTAAVRSAVSEALGREVPAEGERLQVTVRPNTQMLEVRFTAPTPQRAQEGAQGFAEGYLEYRGQQAQAVQEGRVGSLQQQVDETDAGLRRAVAQAAQSDTSSYASQEVQLYAARLAQLTSALSDTRSLSTDPGTVINPAELPETSNEPAAWMVVAGANIAGIFVGVLLAFVREWRRDLVRSGESDDLGVPVFTTVDRSETGELASTDGGSTHEAYRRLRAAVIANGSRPHALAIAPVDGEPSMIAADLAVTLAQAKLSVLLIALDPDNALIRGALGLADRPGVAEAVSLGADVDGLILQTDGISVLAPGLDTGTTPDLAATPAFREIVAQLQHRFDYIVIDGFPAVGEEVLLVADSALLVLTQDRTTRLQVAAALDRLEQLGVPTLGAVSVRRNGREALPPTANALAEPRKRDAVMDRAESRAHA